MKNKKTLFFSTILLASLGLGCVATIHSEAIPHLFFANSSNPYGVAFNEKTNILSTNNEYSPIPNQNKATLISKANDITFETKNVKALNGGWQSLAKENSYVRNIDHIIGMDEISLKMKANTIQGELNIYYSHSEITDENKINCPKHVVHVASDQISLQNFDFKAYKPNYLYLEANKADLDILEAKISINQSCHDFYKNVEVINENPLMGQVEGDGKHFEGTKTKLSAVAHTGYEFAGWYKGENLVSMENPYEIEVGYNDSSYSVKFNLVASKGQTIQFGNYPQRKVNDEQLITDLNIKAGTLPVNGANGHWTSYKYYIENSNTTDFMWYQDVELANEAYRGVYFTSYRPWFTNKASNAGNCLQDNNGYLINNVYWFKYEPINWKVLNNNGLAISEIVLDSQDFYHGSGRHDYNNEKVYANNYEASDIRNFLNDNLYNIAFTNNEKALVTTSLVDNSLTTTLDKDSKYISNNTNDKVFLLSKQDAFNEEYFVNDEARLAKASDYASCMGCFKNVTTKNCVWWTRSPDSKYSYNAYCVSNLGVNSPRNVYATAHAGVRPALNLNVTK